MVVQDPKLLVAFMNFVHMSVGLMLKAVQSGTRLEYVTYDSWIVLDGVLRKESRVVPYWGALIRHVWNEIEKRQEFLDLVSEMCASPVVARHVNELVGTQMGRRNYSAEHIARDLLLGCFRNHAQLDIPEATIVSEYVDFEAACYASSVEFWVLSPLGEFDVHTEIDLGRGVSVVKLSTDQIDRCVSFGLIRNDGFSMFSPPEFGLLAKYSEPKLFGEEPGISKAGYEQADARQLEAKNLIEEVVCGLLVFKSGSFPFPGMLIYSPNWFYRGQVQFSFGSSLIVTHNRLGRYTLSDQELPVFTDFWMKLQTPSIKARKALQIALRRFSYASIRPRDEDRIIDLLISAEALFLNDLGDATYRGELRFRLALRAAHFTATASDEQKEIYRHWMRAYDVRSAIVHGDNPRLPKQADGSTTSLAQFIKVTQDYLRLALHRAVTIAAEPGSPKTLVDWEATLFPKSLG